MLVPALANPISPGGRIGGVLFDLDGTLYDQGRMRARMAAELLGLPLSRPLDARRVWKGLRAYRRAQEQLRTTPGSGSVSRAQLEHAAASTGVSAEVLAPMVQEWMLERPLKHMRACRASGLTELLTFLGRSGAAIGLLSDYPADAKLRALGVAEHFTLVLSAADPEVNAFKPDPGGFLAAARRWQLAPAEVLVVGDRMDVDAAGAAAAGMPCVIVSRSARAAGVRDGVMVVDSLERLHRVLDGQR